MATFGQKTWIDCEATVALTNTTH